MKPDFKSDTSTAWPFLLPVDGWYQLCPRGEFPGKDELSGEEVTQVIDQEAIDSMLREFDRQSADENFTGLLIDYDHFSEDLDKPTVAAGWIIELEERESGIWFRARWSAEGETNLKSGCYRNISPSMRGVFIGEGRVRPLLLDRAGLTNDPKFKNMRPLSNRGGGEAAHNSHRTKETRSMKKLLALLGLSAEASEDAAAEALTTLINRDTTAQADLATMKNRAETAEAKLETAIAAAVSAEADAFCEANEAKIKDRAAVHAQFIKDPEGTKTIFAGIEVGKTSLRNRATRQPGQDKGNEGDNAKQLEAKIQEYKGLNRCTYQQAFDAVAASNPELLKSEDEAED